MRTLSHKIIYFVVLVATLLLMGERIVPHHHCAKGTVCGNIASETVHFGYGNCKDCEHNNCNHNHKSDNEQCCDDSLLYFRLPGNYAQIDKKLVVSNDGCFILPEQMSIPIGHVCSSYSCYCRLEISDIGARHTALRAPPAV